MEIVAARRISDLFLSSTDCVFGGTALEMPLSAFSRAILLTRSISKAGVLGSSTTFLTFVDGVWARVAADMAFRLASAADCGGGAGVKLAASWWARSAAFPAFVPISGFQTGADLVSLANTAAAEADADGSGFHISMFLGFFAARSAALLAEASRLARP